MTSVVCDLDGVVYRGKDPVPGAAPALLRLVDSGLQLVFATNNSSRTPNQIADKIEAVVGVVVDPDSIVTSALAAVSILPDNVRRCLVVGGEGIKAAIVDSGREVVDSDSAASVEAVVVGIDSRFTYELLARASDLVREGALFVASNTDATFPVESGLLPGAGAIVAAIATASGVEPIRAGKPEIAMRSLIRQTGVSSAWVIGDRIETDIALASAEPDWKSILVLTGVTAAGDDHSTADFVAADLAAAIDLVLAAEDRQ